MVMHAWLRNTVMRLRFIKPRAVLSHKELCPGRDAKRRDAVHRVDSVGTERRAGIVYCASSINPPPSPISSRTHPASSRKRTKRVAQESRRRKKEQDVDVEGRQVRQRTKAENDGLKKKNVERGREGEKERERDEEGATVYKERVQTRQLRTRSKTAIKSRDKQTTNPFCPPHLTSVAPLPLPPTSPFMLAQSLFLPFSVMLHPTDHE
ncbi:hypothetical protein ALC57_07738 [Trachymyrmex cornetzi]|uniref:Uncharacterized protein n=1 Tax=Trachymyrmex cornetzi TaxID=471704 RepID=A0A195E486_9HYME|nr:hypothetical protein ALC57_07738 [Trachymyrmex cornetzi]